MGFLSNASKSLPCVDKGGQVQKWVTVKLQLVVDDLICGVCVRSLASKSATCNLTLSMILTVEGILYFGIGMVP